MVAKSKELRRKGIDTSLYEHPLFDTITEVSESMSVMSFKEASNMVGGSLIDDFSEINSVDS